MWQRARMGIRLGSTVVNCADIEVMTDFWTAALGLVPNHREAGDDFRVLRGERVNLSLQGAGKRKGDVDAHVERLRDLGAEWVRREDDPEDTYVVLRDPEGNEFCVCLVAGS